MKTWARALLGLGLVAGGVVIASTPPRLSYEPPAHDTADLGALLLESESGLIPETEKRLAWHDGKRVTEWSVVALHGFSASRQETAPLAEIVAGRLNANLFEARYTGHGLKTNGLQAVSAEAWLDDTVNALAIGRQIGNKVVVIAVSTGATMAMSLLDHPEMQFVDTLVFLSPNFAPADPKGMWITYPGGPLLLRLLTGATRSWEAFNERQALYWTTRYPSKTLIQVIRAVDRANIKLSRVSAPRVQFFYSPNDRVISVAALETAFERIKSPQKEIIVVTETGAPSAHIIAGDIISPKNTASIAERIAEFILRPTR